MSDLLLEVLKEVGKSAVVLAILGFLLRSVVKTWFAGQLETHKDRLKSASDQRLLEARHEADKDLAELKRLAGEDLERLRSELTGRVNERLASVNDLLQRDRDLAARSLDANQQRKERLRAEILRWSNPILGAVSDLESRLDNILTDDAYGVLDRTKVRTLPEDWSISYDYFMPSTLFLFAQYFHWVRRLQVEISFELFETQVDKDQFLEQLRRVSKMLGDWPLIQGSHDDLDCQVFSLQQRGIAEAVTVRADGCRCMDFHEFMDAWEDLPLSDRLAPLRNLLEGIEPACVYRWKRLEMVRTALGDLDKHCRTLLRPL